jgi:hypothetical protein
MGKYVAINRHSRTIRNSIAELVVMVLVVMELEVVVMEVVVMEVVVMEVVVMELEEVVLELVLMGRIVDYKIRRNNSSGLVVVAVELVEEMEMAVELAEEMEMEMELAEETDYLHMDWAHPHCLHSFQTLRYNSQVDNTDTQQNYPVRIL